MSRLGKGRIIPPSGHFREVQRDTPTGKPGFRPLQLEGATGALDVEGVRHDTNAYRTEPLFPKRL